MIEKTGLLRWWTFPPRFVEEIFVRNVTGGQMPDVFMQIKPEDQSEKEFLQDLGRIIGALKSQYRPRGPVGAYFRESRAPGYLDAYVLTTAGSEVLVGVYEKAQVERWTRLELGLPQEG